LPFNTAESIEVRATAPAVAASWGARNIVDVVSRELFSVSSAKNPLTHMAQLYPVWRLLNLLAVIG
jgi:hypothetical protein